MVSGFYVLHDQLEGATGSCETDGRRGPWLWCGPSARARANVAGTATRTTARSSERASTPCRVLCNHEARRRGSIKEPLPLRRPPDGVDHLEALKGALEKAWEQAGEVDALVAVERVRPVPQHQRKRPRGATEPVDVLWPHVDGSSCGEARTKAGIRKRTPSPSVLGMAATRSALGRVAQLDAVASLSPGEDFCALGVNGRRRGHGRPPA